MDRIIKPARDRNARTRQARCSSTRRNGNLAHLNAEDLPMRTRAFEKWVIVGTAAFALSSSVALKLAISSEHPVRLSSDEPLLSQIQRGAAVTVKLYPDACDIPSMGQLSCTSVYAGYYNRRKNAWVMTGELDSPKGHIVTGNFWNAPDQPGNISLWGILGTFDNDGNLILHGRVRGSIITAWQNADR